MVEGATGQPGARTSRRRGLGYYVAGFAVFAGFIGFVEYYIGWTRLLAPWSGLSPVQTGAALALIFLSYIVRSLRLFSYLRLHRLHDFALCLKVMLQHNMYNNLLPMRTGEASFPLLLKRYFGLPLVSSLPVLLWFRLLDMHTLVTLALAAVGSDILPGKVGWLLLLLWNAVPYAAFRGAGSLGRKLGDGSSPGRAARLLARLLSALPATSRGFWLSWCWTLFNWVIKLGAFAWALQFFIDIPLRVALLGAVGGDLTSVLPVHSVAGMGTYEGGIVAALLPFGVDADHALAAAVNLHLLLLAATLVSGLLSLLIPGRNA